MRDKNTFEAPDTVASREFELTIGNGNLEFTIPACSVLHITVEE